MIGAVKESHAVAFCGAFTPILRRSCLLIWPSIFSGIFVAVSAAKTPASVDRMRRMVMISAASKALDAFLQVEVSRYEDNTSCGVLTPELFEFFKKFRCYRTLKSGAGAWITLDRCAPGDGLALVR